MGYLNTEDGLMTTICSHDIDNKIIVERERYVIMTSDKKQIFCGIARNMHFRDVNNIGDVSVKTYLSEKKAKASFMQSWSSAYNKPEVFDEGGSYTVVKIVETLSEV